MKVRISIFLVGSLFLLFTPLFAQTTQPGPQVHTRDCSNYNSFRNTQNASLLLSTYADEISPMGIIHLDPMKTQNIGGSSALYPYFDLDPKTTFEPISSIQSFTDSNYKIVRYQQYYHGVPVEGGGYVEYIPNNGGCDEDGMIAVYPYLSTGLSLDLGSTINEDSLPYIIGNSSISKQELCVAPNLLGDCNYHLAWRVDYQDSSFKRAWVNAKTGTVIKVTDVSQNLLAEIAIDHPDYGNGNDVELDDYTNASGLTILENMPSGDGLVETYDFLDAIDNPQESEWTADRVPTTQALVKWPDNMGPMTPSLARVYQAHYVSTKVVKVIAEDLIPIRETRVAQTNLSNAVSLYPDNSTIDNEGFLEEAWIMLGGSYGVYDVVGHELGHSIMRGLGLGYSIDNGSATVHEGLADFFGLYAESRISGLDWIMGDDSPTIGQRDFENLQYPCVEDMDDAPGPHTKSDPLRRWFYLLVEGSSSNGIEAIPLLDLMEMIMDIVAMMPSNGNYEDFIDSALEWASMNNGNGSCSDIYTSFYNAFGEICAELLSPSLVCLRIQGPNAICEESEVWHTFQVANYDPNLTYKWNFPGEWTVPGSVPNTNIYYGSTLLVSDWPKYPYFPRKRTLKLSANGQQTDYHTVTFLDCLGDDPNCPEDEFNGDSGLAAQSQIQSNEYHKSKTRSEEVSLEAVTKVVVYDFYGHMIFSGTPAEAEVWKDSAKGLFILTRYDKEGQIIKSEKVYFLN